MYASFDESDLSADYLLLLRAGSVMRRLAPGEHAAWRRAIRRKARSDELRIKTWSQDGTPATVWAVLPDWTLTRDQREQLLRRLSWQRE